MENASGRRNGISPGRDAALAPAPGTSFAAFAGSGGLELLVAEVGDEIEGAAEGGDVAVQDVLGGDVASFDLGDRATEIPILMATCSWSFRAACYRILGSQTGACQQDGTSMRGGLGTRGHAIVADAPGCLRAPAFRECPVLS